MSLPPLIEAMRQPSFYPHGPASVELVQTHISFVFLAGDSVYKVKKPVHFSFLDFSTLPLRRHFCHEEVRLNRRLAAGIYRGVVGLHADASSFSLCAENDPTALEYAVHMRRIPEDLVLTHFLQKGSVPLSRIDGLAERLVEFHKEARCDELVTANGAPAALAAILEENFAAVRTFRGRTISAADDDAIQRFSQRFMDRHRDLFTERQRAQRIRECHGDLHSEHICLTEPPIIFDCIEFNERFRYCDVASEIAFLTMDLEYHHHTVLAERLASHYARLAQDADLRRLLPFYQCYRAYVRGKVDSLKSAESEVDPEERRVAQDSARRHFALAYRYTWTDRPSMVIVCGMSGTGKSTLAAALGDRIGHTHVNSDVVRKELVGLPPAKLSPAETALDLYSADHTQHTYRAVLDRAAGLLESGKGVILDATFQRRTDRDAARSLAKRHGVAILFVECACPSDDARRRLDNRTSGPSDADWRVYLKQEKRFEPLAEDERVEALVLDTRHPASETVADIEQALRRRLGA